MKLENTLALLFCVLMISSCTTILGSGDSQENLASVSANASTSRSYQSQQQSSKYYDFEDILVPREMELVPENSLMFHTTNIKAGAMHFKGRVEPISLFNFFMDNMPKDNWNLLSYFKYNKYLLVFEKNNRVCVMRIQDKRFQTNLQVWVTPKISAFNQQNLMQEEKLQQ